MSVAIPAVKTPLPGVNVPLPGVKAPVSSVKPPPSPVKVRLSPVTFPFAIVKAPLAPAKPLPTPVEASLSPAQVALPPPVFPFSPVEVPLPSLSRACSSAAPLSGYRFLGMKCDKNQDKIENEAAETEPTEEGCEFQRVLERLISVDTENEKVWKRRRQHSHDSQEENRRTGKQKQRVMPDRKWRAMTNQPPHRQCEVINNEPDNEEHKDELSRPAVKNRGEDAPQRLINDLIHKTRSESPFASA